MNWKGRITYGSITDYYNYWVVGGGEIWEILSGKAAAIKELLDS